MLSMIIHTLYQSGIKNKKVKVQVECSAQNGTTIPKPEIMVSWIITHLLWMQSHIWFTQEASQSCTTKAEFGKGGKETKADKSSKFLDVIRNELDKKELRRLFIGE